MRLYCGHIGNIGIMQKENGSYYIGVYMTLGTFPFTCTASLRAIMTASREYLYGRSIERLDLPCNSEPQNERKLPLKEAGARGAPLRAHLVPLSFPNACPTDIYNKQNFLGGFSRRSYF